jgi:hypothetical protein
MQTKKTITLAEELFDAVSEQARSEGRTPDELVAEATRAMLSVRRIDAFVDENRRDMDAMGIGEEDVPRLISEYRQERRERR